MTASGLEAQIADRAGRAGTMPPPEVLAGLAAYLLLLQHWNRRINLTGYSLETFTDEAIDRLAVESIVAAGRIESNDQIYFDLGSGGGSPAIPMNICARHLALTMIESISKKCAFLREATRELGLNSARVENCRFEDFSARPDRRASADLVSLRAVRPDAVLWETVLKLLKPGGRVFWFTTTAEATVVIPGGLADSQTRELVVERGSRLRILKRP